MALSREAIGDAALRLVQESGLSSLTMRGVAAALGVQPGALYWHVSSKQELLALLAERILASAPFCNGADGDRTMSAEVLAADLRASLLAVRDGAEIVSFARALRPDGPLPVEPVRAAMVMDPPGNARAGEAVWAARTLVHFVLGSVAEEQNRAELTRAGIEVGEWTAEPPEPQEKAFRYGVRAILRGAGASVTGTHRRCRPETD